MLAADGATAVPAAVRAWMCIGRARGFWRRRSAESGSPGLAATRSGGPVQQKSACTSAPVLRRPATVLLVCAGHPSNSFSKPSVRRL